MDLPLALVLGLAAAALPAPAAATPSPAAAPYVVSAGAVRKSEALLGTQSRLASLVAAQQGVALPVAALAPAVLRNAVSSAPAPAFRRAIYADRPDVFGSVALAVEATPLDRRWQAVAGRRVDAAASRWAASLAGHGAQERIALINRFVNARIAFVDDAVQFGRPDVWQSAGEALRRGRGDCEDYALVKRALLRAAGFADRDLYLVIAKDLVRRSDHAVLAVASEGRLWILDNGTDRVLDSEDVADYRPIFSYSGNQRWTHGYRRDRVQPSVVLAAATSTGREGLPSPASAPAQIMPEPVEPHFTVSAADFLPASLG